MKNIENKNAGAISNDATDRNKKYAVEVGEAEGNVAWRFRAENFNHNWLRLIKIHYAITK